MNKKRIETILDILNEEEDYVTVNYLAEQTGVSDKTVRADLDKLEEMIPQEGLELVRKTGYGIQLVGFVQKNYLQNELSKSENNAPGFSPRERKFIISVLLLIGRKEYYTSDFEEILYYSRSTIHNDLLQIEKFLKSFKIKLVRERNRPIRIIGSERRIRNCLVTLILEHPDIKNIVELITEKDQYMVEDYKDDILMPMNVKVFELKMIISSMKSYENTFINNLPLRSFLTLLLYLLVTIIRYKQGHVVRLSKDFIHDLENQKLYEEVSIICDKLTNVFNVELPEVEKRYIQVYWLSQNRDREANKQSLITADTMARKLMTSWNSQLNIIPDKQENLFINLKKHLTPAIIRFEHGIYFENTMLPKIKRNYPKEYKVVQNSLKHFLSLFDEPIADEEAGYLTLHLLTFIEKTKEKIKVLFVSHISLGGEMFIKERIQKNIPFIVIVNTVNYFSFYETDLTEIDLIISTVDVRIHEDIPFVLVSSIIENNDLKTIQKIVNTL